MICGFIANIAVCAQAVELTTAPLRPLTETETLRLVRARPAVHSLHEAHLEIARSEVGSAGRWPNPQFQFSRESVDRSTGDAIDEFYWLSQRVEISGQRGLHKRAAEERVGAAELATDAEHVQIDAETRTLFYRVLHQQLRVRAIERWTGQIRAIEAVVRKRQAAGDVSGYDALRLTRERASIEAMLQQALAKYRRVWAILAVAVGGADVAVAFDGVAGELLPPPPLPLTDLLGRLSTRPDIAQLEREAAAHELERRAGDRGWVPELTLGLGHKVVDDELGRDSGPMVSAGISIPLFNRGQSDSEQAAAQAVIARTEAQLALATAEGAVRGRWHEVTELITTAHALGNAGRADTARLIEIAEAAYRGGELGVLELLDAYRGAHEADLQRLDIMNAAREAHVELDRLTGGPTR